MHDYIIGVDGGGSKTHAILIDKTRNIIAEAFNGSANINSDLSLAQNSIKSVIDELILKYQLQNKNIAIGIGVAGYSAVQNRNQLLKNLSLSYPTIKLSSDCHIACLAAHSGHEGCIIICGTGVVGYYIQNNIGQQIGGWGFPHGDLGGAAWLGLEICRYTCKAIDGIIPFSPLLNHVFNQFNHSFSEFKIWLLQAKPSDYAHISRLISQFKDSDSNAHKIFAAGICEIVTFIHSIKNKAPTQPIKMTGGIASAYFPELKKTFADLEISNNSPAYGACLLF